MPIAILLFLFPLSGLAQSYLLTRTMDFEITTNREWEMRSSNLRAIKKIGVRYRVPAERRSFAPEGSAGASGGVVFVERNPAWDRGTFPIKAEDRAGILAKDPGYFDKVAIKIHHRNADGSISIKYANVDPAMLDNQEVFVDVASLSSDIQASLEAPGAACDCYPKIDMGDSRYRNMLADFFSAARSGDVERVRYFIEQGIDPNAESQGERALHMATKNGHRDIAALLIDSGADVDARDDEGRSALHSASEWPDRTGLIALLVAKGADMEIRDSRGYTPLLAAVRRVHNDYARGNTEAALALIRAGAKVDAIATENTADREDTPLITAIKRGNLEIAQALLQAEAKTDSRTGFRRRTALHFAAEEGNDEAVALLLRYGADRSAEGGLMTGTPEESARGAGHTALADTIRDYVLRQEPPAMASGGGIDRARKAIDATNPRAAPGSALRSPRRSLSLSASASEKIDDRGRSALFRAGGQNNPGLVQSLIKSGADPNRADARGHLPLTQAVREGYSTTALALVAGGADANTADSSGRSPLHMAADYGRADLVEPLVTAGADPNALRPRGSGQESALEIALRRGHHEAAQALIAHIDPSSQASRRALMRMVSDENSTHLIPSILAKGVDPDTPDDRGRLPLTQAVREGHSAAALALVTGGADAKLADSSGRSPLHMAADYGRADLVGPLVAAGADPNALREGIEESPLEIAIRRSQSEAARAIIAHADPNARAVLFQAIDRGQTDLVAPLLARGADAGATRDGGESVLHLAVKKGDMAAARALVAKGADTNPRRGRRGTTPLFLAASEGNLEMVQFLLNSGADPTIRKRPLIMGKGTSPEEAARRGGHDEVADAIRRASKKR